MREVWFRKCPQCWTMAVLWASAMGSNPRAFPIGPSSPSSGSGERRGWEDRHRAFLSQPHPAGAASWPGLPMSLYTPGSSLFAEAHDGKFTTTQTVTGALGNAAITIRDSPRPQTLGLFLKLWMSLCLMNELVHSLCIGCLNGFDSLIQQFLLYIKFQNNLFRERSCTAAKTRLYSLQLQICFKTTIFYLSTFRSGHSCRYPLWGPIGL